MTDYEKYTPWGVALVRKYGTNGENHAAHMAEAGNPNLEDFLNHHREQCQQATEKGSDDYRWLALSRGTESAAEALQSGDITQIAIAFFHMGQDDANLCHLSSECICELYEQSILANRYKREKLNREKPLMIKNATIAILKDLAQKAALLRWADDTAREIRIGEMCSIILAEFNIASKGKDWSELLPDTPEGMKPWLREVAPAYAQKRGAPKKEKK